MSHEQGHLHIKHLILVLALFPLLFPAVELLNVKDLDNVQVRDFRTSGLAYFRRHGSRPEEDAVVPLQWKIYGATAKLQGKEYHIGGFRMDIESPEQGSYSVTTASATFDVDAIEVHGDAPVEISGPGLYLSGMGFDLFTDAEDGVENARHLMFVIREAVEMEMDRSVLKGGKGEGDSGGDGVGRIVLSSSHLTMQLTPAESRGGEGNASGRREENGVISLEGNVLLRIPAEQPMDDHASHQWDAWELSGDRMLVFFRISPSDAEGGQARANQVERVEVSGHMRVETDGGRQRLMGDRGVFTVPDERLTVDGEVLMMNQFQKEVDGAGANEERWNFLFTGRAVVFFSSSEERRAQRQGKHRGNVVRSVELPGEVTVVAQDDSYRLVASKGMFSSSTECVSLQGEVRGELRNRDAQGEGDYMLEGPQVDLMLEEGASSAQRMVFPQGLRLQRRDGGSRVKAGWAAVENVGEGKKVFRISCEGSVLAELHGARGRGRELFLTGEKMSMQLRLSPADSTGGLDCIEWIELPERLTVWGREKGIAHRIGANRGRYDHASHAISLDENVVLTLEQKEESASKTMEVQVRSRHAVVRLEESEASRQFGIAEIDLAEELAAFTADYSIYLTAEQAHYNYLEERLELTGKARAEFTPGNGRRNFRQAMVLETTRVLTHDGLQNVVFPEPLSISSADQAVRLSGDGGELDVEKRRCAMMGNCHVIFVPQDEDEHGQASVEMVTQRIQVYLKEREEASTREGGSTLALDRIDVPEHLEVFSADGRHWLGGNHGLYLAQTNSIDLLGEVEAKFAGEAVGPLEMPGLNDFKGAGAVETQEMILNCDHIIARLRDDAGADTRGQEEKPDARALSMLDALEIPSRLQLRSADGSRKVTGERCRYTQAENAITLEGDCHFEYVDERGRHQVDAPRVVFDCNSRTITTGVDSSDDAFAKNEDGTARPPKRTTITIPFATRPADDVEPTPSAGGQKKR
ncbi:MAG: hypothetical protein II943_10805 [Victivallales bacterium]|nr:hypothetical protein [Victivallales bacterium]